MARSRPARDRSRDRRDAKARGRGAGRRAPSASPPASTTSRRAPRTTEEVIEVCRPLARPGASTARTCATRPTASIESLEETFRIGARARRAGGDLASQGGRHRQPRPLARDAAVHRGGACARRRSGSTVYPYCASSTILSSSRTPSPARSLVTWSKPHPEFAGADAGRRRGQAECCEVETPSRQLLPAGAIYFSMDEDDVQRILAFEHTMIGSDGLPHDAAPHPRLWGTSRACSATTRAT